MKIFQFSLVTCMIAFLISCNHTTSKYQNLLIPMQDQDEEEWVEVKEEVEEVCSECHGEG